MKPFKIEVPQATLDKIREKVAAYEWHEMPRGEGLEDRGVDGDGMGGIHGHACQPRLCA